MGIVRGDKRQAALSLVREVRTQIDGLLRQADALQATVESLELELGLSTEKVQSQRAQCLVMHYQEGSEVGHTLDECSDECAANELIEELENEDGQDEGQEKPGETG